MPKRTRVCSHLTRDGKSCPNLAEPGSSGCIDHPGRPKNASWSRDRNPAAHAKWAKAILERDNHRCTRCGSTWKLQAHHDKPGYTLDCGRTLCGRCHGLLDKNAR